MTVSVGQNRKPLIFENGQFSRHFVFDKNNFVLEKKNLFTPINKNFVFLKKNIFLFFEKQCFFGEFFFEKVFFKISKSFPPIKKFVKFFYNFFEKKISKKNIVFQKKRKMFFFQKNKGLVYRGKQIFFSKNEVSGKLSVFKNGGFRFCPTDTIV